jgi:hypothetical protein
MGCTDQFDIAAQVDAIASFIEMRRVARGAGSVIVHDGYLWEPGRPDVHFGALCKDAINLRLDRGRPSLSSEGGLAGLVAMMRLGEGPSMDAEGPRLCTACQKRSQAMLRDVCRAPESHQAFAPDAELSVVFFGHEQEIVEVWRGLAYRAGPDE